MYKVLLAYGSMAFAYILLVKSGYLSHASAGL